MKTIKHLLFLCFLSVLVACSEDTFIPQSEISPNSNGNSVDLISMVVPDIEMDDATTRSKLIDDGTGLKFAWQENDAIGIVPMSGNPLRFPINADNAGKSTAIFDGGGWALRTDMKYAAFFPINEKNQGTDIKHIAIDYAGQTQGNYMKYDFLATGAVKPSDGQVTFNMKRLSAILKISISMPAGSTSRYGTLVAPEEAFDVKGCADLSGNEPIYSPLGKTKFINTDLGIEKTSASAWTYEVYMMIPPTNLSGKTLTFRLTSDAGYAYEANLQGKNFEAGKAYQLSGEAQGATIKNLNLIAAAENTTQNPDVGTFVKNTDGTVNINDNLEKIASVVSVNVAYIEDPTICDEIGYFRNLEKLTCGNYLNTEENLMIQSLDVSNNRYLKSLICGCNNLTTLDLSKNTMLTQLYCFNNKLTSLDLSNNPQLQTLMCYRNSLTSLDLSNNPELNEIVCYNNQITSLDVSNNTELMILQCDGNKLTTLDVSNNTNLEELSCTSNPFEELSITNMEKLVRLDISNCPSLKTLKCQSNHLSTLYVQNDPALELLWCQNNYLDELNLSGCTALKQLRSFKNMMSYLDISGCTSLYLYYPRLDSFCLVGDQYADENRNSYQEMTLKARSNDTTDLNTSSTSFYNEHVTVTKE